jgi:hypothetical protein
MNFSNTSTIVALDNQYMYACVCVCVCVFWLQKKAGVTLAAKYISRPSSQFEAILLDEPQYQNLWHTFNDPWLWGC